MDTQLFWSALHLALRSVEHVIFADGVMVYEGDGMDLR
eukprot:gene14612-10139_t